MCYPIGARLAQRRILALDTLYHHLFSTPGRDATTTNQLKHDLVLWLTHHSFEELPDALEYYLADPNSDLEGDLAHLTCLDPWGVQVHIHPLVTIYIKSLLAWAKCFLATYGVYPGLYDLLDTPRLDFLAAQLHLRDTTLPRPLLHRSRGPPTIRSEYVALQPHLAPSPPPDRLYVCRTTRPSFYTSVCRATSPSVLPTAPTVCLSPQQSVALSVHPTDSPSIIPAHQSHTIHRTQDSSQSLAVVNGEQSRKAKQFHRAFTNYDLLLRALDASSIYLHDFRHVAPPKSGEDAHVTRGKCDFGGATLPNPILGLSYALPRLWDPGGVSSSANTPSDLSRTIAPSRYPNTLLTGYLINLPSLRRWQDLRTSHVKLDNFIHGNITGLTTAMKTITGSINVSNPALTRPTPTHHERDNPYDRQSSRTNFNATVTPYIRVTKNLKRCVETTSPYEGHTSCTFFARLLDSTSGLLRHTSGLPKILPRLPLTLLTMLGLWGVPYERPRLVDAPRTTPTYYLGGRVYVRCQFTTPRWGVTRFYRCLGYVLVVLNLSVPKIIIS